MFDEFTLLHLHRSLICGVFHYIKCVQSFLGLWSLRLVGSLRGVQGGAARHRDPVWPGLSG